MSVGIVVLLFAADVAAQLPQTDDASNPVAPPSSTPQALPPSPPAPPSPQAGDPSLILRAPPLEEPRLRSFIGSVALGTGYRSLYGQSYPVGVIDLRAGAELRRVGVELLGQLLVEPGAVSARVPMTYLRAGFMARGIWNRFRFGGGLRFGVLFFNRVTNGELNFGGVFNVLLSTSVDLFARGRTALFLGVEAGLDITWFTVLAPNSPSYVSPTITALLGVRL